MAKCCKTKKLKMKDRFESGEFDDEREERKSEGSHIRQKLLREQRYKCAGLIYPDGSYRECNDIPTDLDHIIELRHGGPNEYANYQMLCCWCHINKTAWNKKQNCGL